MYILRTQMYHCTTEELRRMPLSDILQDLQCRSTEAFVQRTRLEHG